jgi:hypothetical protein
MKAYRILVRKPEGNRPLERETWYEDGSKMDPKETG